MSYMCNLVEFFTLLFVLACCNFCLFSAEMNISSLRQSSCCAAKFHDILSTIQQDYEYASYNPVAYDLANHFCEMAANYHSETPHILDYNIYPGNPPFTYDIHL